MLRTDEIGSSQQWALWMLKLCLLPCFYWCCEKYILWKGLFLVDTIIFKIIFPHLPVVGAGPWASALLLNYISSPALFLLFVFRGSAPPSENVDFVLGFCFCLLVFFVNFNSFRYWTWDLTVQTLQVCECQFFQFWLLFFNWNYIANWTWTRPLGFLFSAFLTLSRVCNFWIFLHLQIGTRIILFYVLW